MSAPTERMRPVTLVGCDETPPQYRNRVGQVHLVPDGTRWPAPGTAGTFMGVPGVFLDFDEFQIRPVDMRTTAQKHLDEAALLLAADLALAETPIECAIRQAKAQHLLLLAQLDILRRMEARA